jgi:hypothetical protein
MHVIAMSDSEEANPNNSNNNERHGEGFARGHLQ